MPPASRGNEGALHFVPSTKPLEVIWKPEMPFCIVYWALRFTYPLSHSLGVGTSKEAAFWYELAWGSIFQGDNEIRPHAQSTEGVSSGPKPDRWVLVPRRKRLTLVLSTPLVSRAARSCNLTPGRPMSSHWSEKFSLPLFTHFPRLPPQLPGPQSVNLEHH